MTGGFTIGGCEVANLSASRDEDQRRVGSVIFGIDGSIHHNVCMSKLLRNDDLDLCRGYGKQA